MFFSGRLGWFDSYRCAICIPRPAVGPGRDCAEASVAQQL